MTEKKKGMNESKEDTRKCKDELLPGKLLE